MNVPTLCALLCCFFARRVLGVTHRAFGKWPGASDVVATFTLRSGAVHVRAGDDVAGRLGVHCDRRGVHENGCVGGIGDGRVRGGRPRYATSPLLPTRLRRRLFLPVSSPSPPLPLPNQPLEG